MLQLNFQLKLSNSANLFEKKRPEKIFFFWNIFKMTEITMFLHDGHKIQFTYTFVMWERPKIIKIVT